MNIKEFIQSNKWHEWHIRHRSPLFTYFIFYSASIRAHPLFPHQILSGGIALDHVLTKESELVAYRTALWSFFKSNPNGILEIMRDMYAKNKHDREIWQTYADTSWSLATDAEILEKYTAYVAFLAEYGPSIYIPLAIETLLSDTAVECLQKQFGSEWIHYENIVMTPVRDSSVTESRRSLLRIANLIRQKNSEAELQIARNQHFEQFSFLKNKGFFFEFYDQSDFESELSGIEDPESELRELDEAVDRRNKDWDDLMEKIDDEYARKLLLTTNEAIFFRTWRVEVLIQSSWYMQSLFAEIASRIGLDNAQDVLYLYPNEITEAFDHTVSLQEKVARRKKGYIFLTDEHSNILTIDGDEALTLEGMLKFKKEFSGELRGTPAYRGKVRGKVLVVTDRADFPKIVGAEILVTHCTFPEMVPYMARVKAIVTEEGGILSHAALISRELKIPSVIGTKVATQVLQNGDLVEVDAEVGVVRRVKGNV